MLALCTWDGPLALDHNNTSAVPRARGAGYSDQGLLSLFSMLILRPTPGYRVGQHLDRGFASSSMVSKFQVTTSWSGIRVHCHQGHSKSVLRTIRRPFARRSAVLGARHGRQNAQTTTIAVSYRASPISSVCSMKREAEAHGQVPAISGYRVAIQIQ